MQMLTTYREGNSNRLEKETVLISNKAAVAGAAKKSTAVPTAPPKMPPATIAARSDITALSVEAPTPNPAVNGTSKR